MCKYCERKPVLHKGWYIYDTYADNQEEIATGDYTTLYIAVDNDGRLCMRACGDDCTGNYYPKFCPECGAKLIDDDKPGSALKILMKRLTDENELK